jgi:uncharacterized protein (TIGR03437 family)
MILRLVLGLCIACSCWAGAFGTVVAIGGQAADLALDEARGLVYLANFGANRIEVISTSSLAIERSINVAAQPSAVTLSPNGRFLLAAHFGNFVSPQTANNALTLIDLNSGGKQTFALGSPPLGAAFGYDNRALVVTSTQFLLFDPVSGAIQQLASIADVTANTLPAPPPDAPAEIVAASVAASGDARFVFGLTDTIRFRYDVERKSILSLGYTSTPPMGPRAVAVSRDGSFWTGGWALFDHNGRLWAQFPNPSGALATGGHAFDTARGLIYAQVPEAASGTTDLETPILQIVEADNLAVRERLILPENLAGKGVLSSDGSMMYAVSESGLLALPVGALGQTRRVEFSQEDVVFPGKICSSGAMSQDIVVWDLSGAATDFAIASSSPGVKMTPESGTTPAIVRVTADPSAFGTQGTATVTVTLASAQAVNVPRSLRVLVNGRGPDQRGTVVSVPGKLVDVLADPVRNRFYILRQDTNQVLAYEGDGYTEIKKLRTGATPSQMAITFDRRYLLVGNRNSQIANVYDLETLEPQTPIRFPGGHYPQSLASSGRAILAAVRSAVSAEHKIDRVDMASRTATEYASLGAWENNVNVDTMLTASPNGSTILGVEADGGLLLYNSGQDAFTAYRKPYTTLAGAYAASSYDRYVVDNHLLNASLVEVKRLESATGSSSGFAFVDDTGLRTTVASASGPGVVARVNLATGESLSPTRMVEAPLLGETGAVFTRTLAPLSNRKVIVSLTASGFTVLPWNYEASVAAPHIERVVNLADQSAAVAPGSLVAIFGWDLSPVNLASAETPLPTALGDSCLSVNGSLAPILFVSPNQVNAQLPYNIDGNVTLTLMTPGGVSDNYMLVINSAAPGVFHTAIEGLGSDVPTVIREKNGLPATPSNPLHRGDYVIIYLAGLGRTNPAIEAGAPGPYDPLAWTETAPTVTLGGWSIPVMYAGLTPGMVGVYQINAFLPTWGVPTGLSVPLTITQDGYATTVNVRVVGE